MLSPKGLDLEIPSIPSKFITQLDDPAAMARGGIGNVPRFETEPDFVVVNYGYRRITLSLFVGKLQMSDDPTLCLIVKNVCQSGANDETMSQTLKQDKPWRYIGPLDPRVKVSKPRWP